MKKIINILAIIVSTILFISLLSCHKEEHFGYTFDLTEIFNYGDKKYIFNNEKPVNVTITSGKYNCSGDFRIYLDNDMIFWSRDYDYFIPKKTKLYSATVPCGEGESSVLSVEIKDETSTIETIYGYRTFTYYPDEMEIIREEMKQDFYSKYKDDYDVKFNSNTNKVSKGDNIVLFKCDNLTATFCKSSNKDLHIKKLVRNRLDTFNDHFSYVILESNTNDYQLSESDLSLLPLDEYINVYAVGNHSFAISTDSKIITLAFVSPGDETKKYNIKCVNEYYYYQHYEDGKIIEQSDKSEEVLLDEEIQFSKYVAGTKDHVYFLRIQNEYGYTNSKLHIEISAKE